MPVFGNYFLMLLTYYYFSWSVLFLFFFCFRGFFFCFSTIKKQKRQTNTKAVLRADIPNLFLGVFFVSILEFFILGFSVLFEQDNIDFMKEL